MVLRHAKKAPQALRRYAARLTHARHFGKFDHLCHIGYFLAVAIEGHGLYAIMGLTMGFIVIATMIGGDEA